MSLLTTWPTERYVPTAFAEFKAQSQFDLGTARALMWLSQLAYELDTQTSPTSLSKVKDILQRWEMQLVDTVAIPGFPQVPVQALRLLSGVTRDALVISGRGAIVIAFAGTDPPRAQDWLLNFSAVPTATTGVSRGLSDAAAAFSPALKSLLDQHNNSTLFVTGHSLGGSLGVAVAYELSKLGRNAEAVYTFGMPRAGNAVFAAAYDQRLGARTFRFVHGEDLVPTVPPANFAGIQHQHVGWLIHCARGAKFDLNQKSQDTRSNEPLRDDDIVSGLLEPTGWLGRGWATWGVLTGGGRPLDAAIELLPPRVRQHLQDQYIAALTR